MSDQEQELHEAIERRMLGPNRVGMLIDDGSLVLIAHDTGTQMVLDAGAASKLLDLLSTHRELLHRLAGGQAGTHEQEPPEKLDPGLGTR